MKKKQELNDTPSTYAEQRELKSLALLWKRIFPAVDDYGKRIIIVPFMGNPVKG